MKLPKIVYAYDAEYFHDQDPSELAEEGLDHSGGAEIQIYSGIPYKPEMQDEIDFLEAEGFGYLVKNIKVFGIYKDGKF